MLADIQNGTYAQGVDRRERGRAGPGSTRRARPSATHQIEQVGAELRAMMPFLDPVTIKQETREGTGGGVEESHRSGLTVKARRW